MMKLNLPPDLVLSVTIGLHLVPPLQEVLPPDIVLVGKHLQADGSQVIFRTDLYYVASCLSFGGIQVLGAVNHLGRL